MKFGIVRFPGSNSDLDCHRAVTEGLGGRAEYLWHRERDLAGSDVILLPGGFSYGDHLRAGAIARFSPIMREVADFAGRGGPVLGICNGFQVLCEARLLPGALARNAGLRFQSRDVHVRIETADTPFTTAYDVGEVLRLPVANGEGRFVADRETLDRIEAEDRVVLRYVAAGDQRSPEDANPNGSERAIAGVCNGERNVVGVMPHPERASLPYLGSTDGLRMLESVVSRAAGAA